MFNYAMNRSMLLDEGSGLGQQVDEQTFLGFYNPWVRASSYCRGVRAIAVSARFFVFSFPWNGDIMAGYYPS